MTEVAQIEITDAPSPPSIKSKRRKRATEETKEKRKTIPPRIQNFVWGRAAGRCHFCNKALIGDEISGTRNSNSAYIAHIVADSKDGPRGDEIRSPLLAHDPDNLMLVCDTHHRIFDSKDPEMVRLYPEERLLEIKKRHEDRIRIVSEIDEDRCPRKSPRTWRGSGRG